MRLLLAFGIFNTLQWLSAMGQDLPVKNLAHEKIPANIQVDGKIQSAIQWKDSLGINIVVTTETGVYQNTDSASTPSGARTAGLFAYHYLVQKDSVIRVWKLHDNIDKCSDRVDAYFIKNSLHVTDLDSDGTGEIWLAYIKGCRRDSVPCDMKLVMYEGTVQSTLTGQNRVYLRTDEMGGKHYSGGDYAYDTPFYEGPKVFLEYARKQWHKNLERRD